MTSCRRRGEGGFMAFLGMECDCSSSSVVE